MAPADGNDRKTNPGYRAPALTATAPGQKPDPNDPRTWTGVRTDAGARKIVDEIRAFKKDVEERIDHVAGEVDDRLKARLVGYVKAVPLIGILGATAFVIVGVVWGLTRDGVKDAKDAATSQIQGTQRQLDDHVQTTARAINEMGDRVHGVQLDIRELYRSERQKRTSTRLEREPLNPKPWPAKEPP